MRREEEVAGTYSSSSSSLNHLSHLTLFARAFNTSFARVRLAQTIPFVRAYLHCTLHFHLFHLPHLVHAMCAVCVPLFPSSFATPWRTVPTTVSPEHMQKEKNPKIVKLVKLTQRANDMKWTKLTLMLSSGSGNSDSGMFIMYFKANEGFTTAFFILRKMCVCTLYLYMDVYVPFHNAVCIQTLHNILCDDIDIYLFVSLFMWTKCILELVSVHTKDTRTGENDSCSFSYCLSRNSGNIFALS